MYNELNNHVYRPPIQISIIASVYVPTYQIIQFYPLISHKIKDKKQKYPQLALKICVYQIKCLPLHRVYKQQTPHTKQWQYPKIY